MQVVFHFALIVPSGGTVDMEKVVDLPFMPFPGLFVALPGGLEVEVDQVVVDLDTEKVFCLLNVEAVEDEEVVELLERSGWKKLR